VTDGPSTSTIFAVSFLGALFAILAVLLLVYTYVTLRLIPKIKRGLREFIGEVGPRALFEQAHYDAAEAMRQLGISPAEAAAAIEALRRDDASSGVDVDASAAGATRVIFTCEDHGRCVGCPRVLAQFEAIIAHQGEDSFDEVERKCYAHLRGQLAGDAAREGESEAARQKRLAARVVDALVAEGFALGHARGVVWATVKEDRATFAAWLDAARRNCQKLTPIQDEENVA
jgi:hypothetical protein